MKKIFVVVLLVLLLLTISACEKKEPAKPDESAKPVEEVKPTEPDKTEKTEKIKVVTTLFPTYDFAKEIGGDKAVVSLLLPPGVEPHSYEPSPQDIVALSKADVLVYTGIKMEPWVQRLIDSGELKDVLVVDASKGIELMESDHDHDHDHDEVHDHDEDHDHDENHDHDKDHDHDEDHDHDKDHDHDENHDHDKDHDHDEDHDENDHHEYEHHGEDPHIWTDPLNAKAMVKTISEGLSQVDEKNKEFYQKNTDTYLTQLDELHKEYEKAVKSFKSHTIVTGGHFAFGYLAHRYGLEHVSPYSGFAPDSEPTAQNIVELKKVLEETGSKAIYYEELVDPRVAKVLAEEAGVEMLLLHAAHNITKDEKAQGVTYVQIMKNNLENLKKGLE